MSTDRHARRAAYDRTRRQFDDLRLEDKAIFLVEATASTFACGLEEAGRAVAGGLDDLFRGAGRRSGGRSGTRGPSERPSSSRPGAAEPPTGRQQAGPGTPHDD